MLFFFIKNKKKKKKKKEVTPHVSHNPHLGQDVSHGRDSSYPAWKMEKS